RHVLNDDRRLTRNMLGEVSREEAPGKIVVVADGVSDDQSDLFVLVEIRRRWARLLAPRCSRAPSETPRTRQIVAIGLCSTIDRAEPIPPRACAPAPLPPGRSSPRAPTAASARQARSSPRAE